MAGKASCLFIVNRDDHKNPTILLARRAPFKDAAKTQLQSLAYVLQPPVHGKAIGDEEPEETLLAETLEEGGRALFVKILRGVRTGIEFRKLPPVASNLELSCYVAVLRGEEIETIAPCPAIEELIELPLRNMSIFTSVDKTKNQEGVPRDSRVMFADHIEALHEVLRMFC